MAIELTPELIELQRAANKAREVATADTYTTEGWRPWLEAAEAVQAAVTAHAAATGQDRHKVEAALKVAASEPAA